MTATRSATDHATDATPTVRLRFDVIDKRAKELDIRTQTALAELLDLDRASLWRFRKGLLTPSAETAMRIAERLDLKVEDVAERSAR